MFFSADEVSRNEFFHYTSGRWLFNEQQQLALRHVEFSVSALKEAAANAVGASCCDLRKLSEGLFNRAFLLTMNNGTEIVARIPTSISGPAYYTTASEVATIDFMRSLGVPVPNILGWSARAESTPVGAEYILMEKAPGLRLDSLWEQMSPE